MSKRPWRVEYRAVGSDWVLNRTYGAFATSVSAEREVRKWIAASGTTALYRIVNRDTAEVIPL